VIAGHSPYGANGHPHAIESTMLLEMLLFAGIFIAIGVVVVLFIKKKVSKQTQNF
jgi:hypothetical protein